MRRLRWPAVFLAFSLMGVSMTGSSRAADDATETAAVRAAVDQWFVVLNAMVDGDPAPFATLFSHADDVLYMSGEGTYRVGWAAAWADWQEQAAKSLGGHVEGHDIHVIAGGDLATVALVAHATVNAPDGKTQELRVRQTHVFRKEDGVWKMIVHHADTIPVWTTIVDGN